MKNLVILIAGLCAAVPARAAKYAIDTAHSSVSFKIRHLAGKTQGVFKEFSGDIDFDEKSPEKASVTAEIKTASIDTRNEKRDGHLRTGDFFDVEKFPVMTFKSKKVKPAGGNRYKAEGVLTLLGVEKPVTLDVEFGGTTKGPKGALSAGFSASAVINRKDFGMVWNRALDQGGAVLGDEVAIDLEIEALGK